MNVRRFVAGFSVIAPIAFVVSLVVAYVYGLLVHGVGTLEWESSIRIALILGITLPTIRLMNRKKCL